MSFKTIIKVEKAKHTEHRVLANLDCIGHLVQTDSGCWRAYDRYGDFYTCKSNKDLAAETMYLYMKNAGILELTRDEYLQRCRRRRAL